MIRISYIILGLLLLLVQVVVAQDGPTYPQAIKPSPTIEFPNWEVDVYNAFRINTLEYEFSPSYYKDGIVYVSTQAEKIKDKSTNTPFFELYYAILDEDGMPNRKSPFSSNVNTRRHEGQATFNPSGAGKLLIR